MFSQFLFHGEEYQKQDELSICPTGAGFSGASVWFFAEIKVIFRDKKKLS